MFPIRDHTPTRTFPVINYAIIGVTIMVFFVQLAAPDFDVFIETYGFVPARFNFFDAGSYAAILYSIFLHGGLFHIGSNLWFLHIFGDNVEDVMGHLKYIFFYIFCGIAATLGQYLVDTNSTLPQIGASGAISGVIAAYLVFFKYSKIEALIPVGLYMQTILLPSWFFIGYWFVIQVFNGVGSLSSVNQGGVAFFAHIGGFVAGFIIAYLQKPKIPYSSPEML